MTKVASYRIIVGERAGAVNYGSGGKPLMVLRAQKLRA